MRKRAAIMKQDWRMYSPGMVAAGSFFTIAGAIGIIAGGVMVLSGISFSGNACNSCSNNGGTGLVLLLVGGISLGVGIPLIVVGRRKVPPPVASVYVGPRGGGLTFQF